VVGYKDSVLIYLGCGLQLKLCKRRYKNMSNSQRRVNIDLRLYPEIISGESNFPMTNREINNFFGERFQRKQKYKVTLNNFGFKLIMKEVYIK
jgi:hypothetical protein